MTKRAHKKFKRKARDHYATPVEAIVPVIPHLQYHGGRFAEPCAGNGDLVLGLMQLDEELICTYSADIDPGPRVVTKCDALEWKPDINKHSGEPDLFDVIITNPPWERKILHEMILHFQSMAPTWLLFDSDWAYTKQAAPFLSQCASIVAVGRVSWMGNGVSGFDNCSWYHFDALHGQGPHFYGRIT